MDVFNWAYGIVPLEYPGDAPTIESPSRVPTVVTFDDPWWMLGSQAIEAARQAAIVHEGGHPPPRQVIASTSLPYQPSGAISQSSSAQVTVPTDLIRWVAIGGAFLLVGFLVGGRKR